MPGPSVSLPRGAALTLISLGLLVGMLVDALARVMWVEDRVGDNREVLDLVNSNPPSLVVATIVALSGVTLGGILWMRERRSSATG